MQILIDYLRLSGLLPVEPRKRLAMWEQWGKTSTFFFVNQNHEGTGWMPRMIEGGFTPEPDHVTFPIEKRREQTLRPVVKENRNKQPDGGVRLKITRHSGVWLELAWVGAERGNELRVLKCVHKLGVSKRVWNKKTEQWEDQWQDGIVVPSTVQKLPSIRAVKAVLKAQS